ncbi:hypothetical protein [Ruminococcus sp.]|uniref:hypothetical protein n=1 Tax=Ruminococcus sp. TaxID=41978 RepID=UPI00386A6E95
MTRVELQRRVNARKQEVEAQQAKYDGIFGKLTSFVKEMRSRSVIYNQLKNLPVWKELEALIGEKE